MNAPTSSALAAGLSLNHDLIDDFLAEWDQASQAVSATLLEMESAPDRESLRALFRHLHSMKSNLRMVELPDLSAVVHALEDLTEALQSGRIAFETVFGDLILLIIQLLRESSERRLLGGLPSDALATTLIPMLTAMQQAGRAAASARQILALYDHGASQAARAESEAELAFFRQIGATAESRAERPPGALQRGEQIAQQLNALAGHPLSSEQLSAAASLRDVGMGFLPTHLLRSDQALNEGACESLRRHPEISAGLLAALPHWQEARTMVLQHHEHFDGSGSPTGLVGDEIHLGARLLAIVDTFEAMTQRRPHRENRRPILRVVAEVNRLSGQQFDPFWVEVFNRWVRLTFVSPERSALDPTDS